MATQSRTIVGWILRLIVAAILAGLLMLGALGSHIVGPVGLEGDFLMMFFMALAAFLAAAGYIALERTSGGR